MSNLPTVTILTDNGPVTINESDYDSSIHKLVGVEETANPTPTPTGALSVAKNGLRGKASKFIVVDSNGEKVGETEYDTEAEAWAAAMPAVLIEQPIA